MEWTSADKKPRIGVPLLVNVRNSDIINVKNHNNLGGYYTLAYYSNDQFVGPDGGELEITHWIELPKPPTFKSKPRRILSDSDVQFEV